jgi:hypothetical protein
MANASLENISLRDKFWFHPSLRLSYDTTPVQLRSVLSGLAELLEGYPSVENNSIRVSFLSFGTMALEMRFLPTSWLEIGATSSRFRVNCRYKSWKSWKQQELASLPFLLLWSKVKHPMEPPRWAWQPNCTDRKRAFMKTT